MRALRRRRGWLSGWLIATLLFMQLATAAYACPRLDSAAMAAMPDCPGAAAMAMDPDRPLLCKAHCEAGLQSVNSQPGTLDAPPLLALPAALVGVVDVASADGLAAAMPAAQSVGPPAGTPPLYLALLVLRN